MLAIGAFGGCFNPFGRRGEGDGEGSGPPSCKSSCERLKKKTCLTTDVPKCTTECTGHEAKVSALGCGTEWAALLECCTTCAHGGNDCTYGLGCGPREFSPCRHPCGGEWSAVEQCAGPLED